MNDVIVVIRSIGERTTDVCRKIIEDQVPIDNIYNINERPFSEAVKKTLEVGVKSGKWLIAVDADVLLYPDTISRMVEKAKTRKKPFFFYQGAILDKFFFGYRPAGPHLYNCQYMFEALELKSGFENDLRPESFIRDKMEKEGFSFVQDRSIFGLHDFQQSYSGIYKKMFSHALKHKEFMINLKKLFNSFIKLDQDFAVAIAGLKAAESFDGKRKPSEDDLNMMAKEAVTRLGLVEKSEFELATNNTGTVAKEVKEDYLNSLQINERFLAKQRYFPRYQHYIDRLLNQRHS